MGLGFCCRCILVLRVGEFPWAGLLDEVALMIDEDDEGDLMSID